MSSPLASDRVLPELVNAAEAARLIGCGERSLWRWSRSGVAPAPIKIVSAVRYRRAEIMEWIAAGCPRVDRKGASR